MAWLAHLVQFGHPHGSAPNLRAAPAPSEIIGSFEGGKVYSFEGGIVAGERGGVAISGKNEFFANLTPYFRGSALHPAIVRLKVAPAHKLRGVGAYLCTPEARGNYYHWMIDLVPRLWLLQQAGFAPGSMDHLFVNGDGRGWELEPLAAHGFRPGQIHSCREQDRFQVDRLVVPDQVLNEIDFAPWKTKFLRGLFPLNPEQPTRLLFCGRKDAAWRRLREEDDLFARLQLLGFERADTSRMGVAEQAWLFSSARIIVAVHGAALTNMVFSQPGVLLLDIQSRQSAQTFFSSICTAIGARSTVIPATPARAGDNPVERNRIDLTLSPSGIDAIVARVEKELAS